MTALLTRRLQPSDLDAMRPVISHVRIFGGVTDAQSGSLLGHLELWEVPAGQAIFRKGDEPAGIYIVRRGRIDLQITDSSLVIHKHALCIGECFGEASFMSMHCHTSTAVAAEDSEVLVLTGRELNRLRHANLQLFALLMMNLARELARRLYLTDTMLLAATEKATRPQ